jgi:hypothetical protein
MSSGREFESVCTSSILLGAEVGRAIKFPLKKVCYNFGLTGEVLVLLNSSHAFRKMSVCGSAKISRSLLWKRTLVKVSFLNEKTSTTRSITMSIKLFVLPGREYMLSFYRMPFSLYLLTQNELACDVENSKHRPSYM